MYIFQLASQHMTWLAQRQSVLANNVANADTPDYRAKDVGSFETTLDHVDTGLIQTDPRHQQISFTSPGPAGLVEAPMWDQSHSGNTVSIERELMEISQTSRMMSVDTAITKSFHRMMLTSLKV
ncbi:MAG: flagellar basal body rod protein FlgB [Alphaproteobacteria bacterium]|nr:flagellar basal body rod protein FlgB [Alphaproteobacteria bacterium]